MIVFYREGASCWNASIASIRTCLWVRHREKFPEDVRG